MRKYRWIIGIVSVLYALLAVILFLGFSSAEKAQNNRYRVSVNRVTDEVLQDPTFEKDVLANSGNAADGYEQIFELKREDFSYTVDVARIQYLSVQCESTNVVEEFYQPMNRYQIEIVPVNLEGELIGYLRFDYQKTLSIQGVLILGEICMAILYLIVLFSMFYTYHSILRPFKQFSNVPYELSRGNLNVTVKESKNRYFGKFLWGIEMLKDTLDLHNKKELKLTRDKKMILLTLSHDIKTPLNAIQLYSKAIEQGLYTTPEEQVEAVRKIQDKADEINDFVKEIMKTSTEDIISINVNQNGEFYLKDLLNRIQLGYQEKCQLRHLVFQIVETPNHLLKGDMDRVYEAVGNLIENALKYGDGRQITITFTEEEYCQLIHVYNTGTPVDANDMPHLFDSFFRGSNVDQKLGNGLGLYICHEIMTKMKGDIYAERKEDGMEFVLVCPLA